MIKAKAHIFYALEKQGEPLILGMLVLDLEQAVIDMYAQSWRFGIKKPLFIIKKPEEFALSLLNESVVFALVMSGIAGTLTKAPQAKEVPKEYTDYINVFSIEETGCLSEHKNNNHIIDLIEKGDPSYRPLYNLLRPKLKVLCKYFNNALTKGWIRHSINSVGASVLFILKKDGSL